ncbi:MAG: glucosaminidase domain-containing protein [Bacilli bacterium]|jgi:hypothetical protein|nr:glucosaminidase domain-containing protein [Bacilli bacterium]
MKKSFSLLFVLFFLFIISQTSNVFATTNGMVMLSPSNKTCNIYTKYTKGEVITYINPAFGRDAAYLDKKGSRYKIMISGVTGWIDKSCVSYTISYNNMDNYPYKTGGVELNGKDVSRYQVVNNKMYFVSTYVGEYAYTTGTSGYTDVPTGLKNKTIYYSYDGIYFYTNYNTMINDYKANTRIHSANYKYPYYDYYIYLPLRTTSSISATTFDKFLLSKNSKYDDNFTQTMSFLRTIDPKTYTHTYKGKYSAIYGKASSFKTSTSKYQLNSGLLYGIMLNESGNGTSNFSRHYNNPFGWGAVDSEPNNATIWSSMTSAFDKYSATMATSYASVYYQGGNGTNLGNKQSGASTKYASDPYWGYKNAYNYRLLDEKSGKVDKNKYTIGILGTNKRAVDDTLSNEYVYVYQSASVTSKKIAYYERNNASVIIQGVSGSFYKIQNDTGTNKGSAYVLKSNVKAIIGKKLTTSSSNTTNTSTIKTATTTVKDSSGNVVEEKIWNTKNTTSTSDDVLLYSYKFYYNANKTIKYATKVENSLVVREYYYQTGTTYGSHGSKIIYYYNFTYNSNKTIKEATKIENNLVVREYYYKSGTTYANHGSKIVFYYSFIYNSNKTIKYATKVENNLVLSEFHYQSGTTYANHGSKLVYRYDFFYNSDKTIKYAQKYEYSKKKVTMKYYYQTGTKYGNQGSKIIKTIKC